MFINFIPTYPSAVLEFRIPNNASGFKTLLVTIPGIAISRRELKEIYGFQLAETLTSIYGKDVNFVRVVD